MEKVHKPLVQEAELQSPVWTFMTGGLNVFRTLVGVECSPFNENIKRAFLNVFILCDHICALAESEAI